MDQELSQHRVGELRVDRRADAVFVVCFSAGADDADAIGDCLAGIPADADLCSVIVLGGDPIEVPLVIERLRQGCALPVVEAAEGIRLRSRHLYLAHASDRLLLDGDIFKSDLADDGRPIQPIESFFRSLAAALGRRAAVVVWSGSDGGAVDGLCAIKTQGGFVAVQNPEASIRSTLLPDAIATGCVDAVLPRAEFAGELWDLLCAAMSAAGLADERPKAALAFRVDALRAEIRQGTGVELPDCDERALRYQIENRMRRLRIADTETYLGWMKTSATEAETLAQHLQLSAAAFFRDPETLETLAREIIPELIERCSPDRPLRVWVAGCGSGEEAYSLGILVLEQLERAHSQCRVRIFATDLDPELIDRARCGCYPADIADHLTPERLQRYFRRRHQTYEVTKTLRDLLIFAEHRLGRDPSFSQLDLIVCRNTLLSRSAALQQRLIRVFHAALRPGGVLLLAQSDGIAADAGLFERAVRSCPIFRRCPLPPENPGVLTLTATPAPVWPRSSVRKEVSPAAPQSIAAVFERIVLAEFVSPCVLVNACGDLLHRVGRLDQWLEPPAGATGSNLFNLAPPELRGELKAALRLVTLTRRMIVRDKVPLNHKQRVRLTVRPLTELAGESPVFLVAIQDIEPVDKVQGAALGRDKEAASPVQDDLYEELSERTLELRATLDSFESANEQLQSANEQLKTSQEALQFLNAELEGVNTELFQKLGELASANSDIRNLFASTEVSALVLDRQLRLHRFTPGAVNLFALTDLEVGRALSELAEPLNHQGLINAAERVLRTLTPVERQIQTPDGKRWLILRVMPYRTLDHCVQGVVMTFVDISELKRAEEQIRALAFYDPLTGLPNRRLFEERLGVALNQVARDGSGLAVMVLDLDYFKAINDALGHSIGDALLVEVGRRMIGCMRASDTVARPGGDEFMLVVPAVDADGAAHLAEKLVTCLAQPMRLDDHEIIIGCSLGISLAPDDGARASDLISRADTAMYRAKQDGRNRYQFFTKDMQQEALRAMTFEQQLRQALGGADLCLHFQPQVNLDEGRPIGLEALIRWKHPTEKRLLGAGEFVPFAEKSGLILDLGVWVLRSVFRQLQAWSKAGLPLLPVAINMSAQQFRHPDRRRAFSHEMSALLTESGLAPSLLELEITENSLLEETEDTLKTLQELRGLGIRLSLDDFGTGFSSLSALNAFPVDRLKIAQPFVRAAPEHPKQAAIVETILALGRHLEFEVIAEGVETVQHLEQLRRQGCHQAQGYYFSRPIPPAAVESWLRQAG